MMVKTKLKTTFYNLCLIIFMICLSACSKKTGMKFECIQQYKGYSIPSDEWDGTKPTPTLAPTSNSWKVILEDQRIGYANQLIFSGNDQLWFLGEGLFKYMPSTGEIKEYHIEYNEQIGIPQKLFLSKDRTLWAIGSYNQVNQPILYRYDKETDRFDSVVDSNNILNMKSARIGGIADDSKNQLWLVVDDGLYKFDPKTQFTEKVNLLKQNHETINGEIAIDSRDGVWLGPYSAGWSSGLYYFDPSSQQTDVLALGVTGEDEPYGLLIDRNSRLWIGDYAYWNIGTPFPTESLMGLNLIFRSPVFITQRYPFNNFKWLRPRVILEDSEGAIWYSSFGLTKLDPNNGEWCKVLDSGAINIGLAEDSQGNLWTVVDNKLLKHEK